MINPCVGTSWQDPGLRGTEDIPELSARAPAAGRMYKYWSPGSRDPRAEAFTSMDQVFLSFTRGTSRKSFRFLSMSCDVEAAAAAGARLLFEECQACKVNVNQRKTGLLFV